MLQCNTEYILQYRTISSPCKENVCMLDTLCPIMTSAVTSIVNDNAIKNVATVVSSTRAIVLY